MALAFPPTAVSFVLIDFKGTGLILPFRSLPHLAGTISDLDTNITRNLIALENELTLRKALLDAASVSNISAYLRLYREGNVQEPLSYLFLVIDEFAEFKVQFPEFMQVVNRVFSIGRTLGVHIILLTQKPGSVVDDKMNANTRFRWCLKVASSADSQEMLHHPDAARITNPGRAYVQVGEDEIFEQIQSYWSGAPYNPNQALSRQRTDKLAVVDLYGFKHCYEPEKTTGFRAEKNEIDAIVEYLDNYTREHSIPRARTLRNPSGLAASAVDIIGLARRTADAHIIGVAPVKLVLRDIIRIAVHLKAGADAEQGQLVQYIAVPVHEIGEPLLSIIFIPSHQPESSVLVGQLVALVGKHQGICSEQLVALGVDDHGVFPRHTKLVLRLLHPLHHGSALAEGAAST